MEYEQPIADGVEQDDEHAKWVREIQVYEQESEKWRDRGKKILRRYKDERNVRDKRGSKFNILWSNVQTLMPATYNSPPVPNIERRNKDNDDIARVSSEVLERSAKYFLDKDAFDSIMKQAVLDRLLPGRGTAWVRYVVHTKDSPTGEIDDSDDAEPQQEFAGEEVIVDYVHWDDFGHTVVKVWADVEAVWRIAYLDREALIERFGEELGSIIPLDNTQRNLDGSKIKDAHAKAAIYEIWCKRTKKAYWLSKSHPTMLDTRDDPLGLEEFFPCPKPIYATLTTDSLMPIPDYYEYQDQANELDDLTGRIQQITKALKVAGVYDASAQGIQRLLAEGVENQLIPVEQWAVFAGKGGLDGAVSFMPMKDIMETLLGLYQARDKVKADIYEITGMSDIMRGSSDPDETASAQQIKSNFGSMRLSVSQKDVARFARDLVRIITEIIADHFEIETIKNISGVKCMTNAEKQQTQQQIQMAAQQATSQVPPPQPGQSPQQPPAPPPVPDEIQELLDGPSWEDVESLLRNQQIRCYRIDIETDSTIKADEQQEMAARNELITSVGGFLQQAVNAPPEMHPFLMDLLMFGVRANKAARPLEGEFELMQKQLRKQADTPAAPKPDPAVQAAQITAASDLQVAQIDADTKKTEAQANIQVAQMQTASDQKIAEVKSQHDTMQAYLKAVPANNNTKTNYDKNGGKSVETPQAEEMASQTDHKIVNYDNQGARFK